MSRCLASNIRDFLVAATAHKWVDAFLNRVHGEAAASPLALVLCQDVDSSQLLGLGRRRARAIFLVC